MSKLKIRQHESLGTEDNSVAFADPTPSLEQHGEYAPFETVEEALHWLDKTMRAFGTLQQTSTTEFIQHDKSVKSQYSRGVEKENEKTATELAEHGIIAETTAHTRSYYGKNWADEPDRTKGLQRDRILSTMVLTDATGSSWSICEHHG